MVHRSFFKIMFPGPRFSKYLRIPPEFVEHIDKCAYKEAALKDGSSTIWPVKLYEKMNGVFIKKGWEQFFEDHSLGHFEVVFFTYDSETCFNVKIFGKDGVMRLYPTQGDTSSGPVSSEHSLDGHNSEGDEVYNAPTLAEVVPVHGRRKRGRPRKNSPPNSQPPIPLHGKGQDVPNRRSNEFGPSKSFREKMKEVEIIESSEEEITYRLKDIDNENINQISSASRGHKDMNAIVKANVEKKRRGRPFGSKTKRKGQGVGCYEPESSRKPEEKKGLSIDIKKEIIDLSDDDTCSLSKKFNPKEGKKGFFAENDEFRSFRSKFPFFEICIDLDDFVKRKNYMMRIPTTFVKKHFPNMETTMLQLIDENGKSWDVTLTPVSYRFCGGWVYFMRDNELKHGDRCIFELVKAHVMKVFIFRSLIDE